MSKILRRPMFRGGPVDSRGTGITSGLGYEAGGRVGYNQGNLVAPLYTANNNLIKGGDLMQKYTSIDDILKIMPYNMRGAEIKDKYNFDFPINEKSIFIAENPEAQNIKTTSEGDVYFEGGEPKYKKDTTYYPGQGDTQGNQDEIVDLTTEQVVKKLKPTNTETETGTGTGTGTGKEESTEISLDDIRAQADLFKELLGEDREKELKEARISDASDYALKFFEGSQKEGATVGSSAANVAEFAAGRPSMTDKAKAGFKKTDQTATVMAINDYLQGKKSAAEIDKIIKMTDYKGNVNLTNQLKLIELKRGNIAERINEATVSKGLPASVGAIKSILREEGKEITTIPKGKEGTWKPSKEDEGNFIIEEETKNVYQIINGASVKLY